MIVPALVGLALLTATPVGDDGSPSDALGLAPLPPIAVDPPRSLPPIAVDPWRGFPRQVSPAAAAPLRRRIPSPSPAGPAGMAALAMLAVAAGSARGGRRSRSGDAGRAAFPADVVLVFVPGFGSERTGTFAPLVARLGVPPNQYVEFDWRLAAGGVSHPIAASGASVAEGADALEAMLGSLATEGKRVYLVGHSKGGAAIAELVARWDRAPHLRVRDVVGSALLDPPLDVGLLGALQSLGLPFVVVPNDGGYDPQACTVTRCGDARVDLGVASSVEVLVIRNPDAAVTSFVDVPDGLRVHDLERDGGTHAFVGGRSLAGMLERIQEAHTAPIGHPATAACILEELRELRSCRWTAGATWNLTDRPRRVTGVDVRRRSRPPHPSDAG
ncbi:MAG TPA: hypothetical protein VGC47_12380 [Acidimicrobiia bacterium]